MVGLLVALVLAAFLLGLTLRFIRRTLTRLIYLILRQLGLTTGMRRPKWLKRLKRLFELLAAPFVGKTNDHKQYNTHDHSLEPPKTSYYFQEDHLKEHSHIV